jgi:integrase
MLFPLFNTENNTVNDGTILPPRPRRPKVVRDAFRLLLHRTKQRVAAGERSPATLNMQQRHVKYLLKRLPGSTPLERVTTARIASVLAREARGRRRPLCNNTLRKRASTLSQALELARGRAPRLPEIPYRYEPRVEHLPDYASYARLRDALPAERRLWFVLAAWTGQRESDVERMRREDLDLVEEQVLIRSTKTKRAPSWFHAAPELLRELGDHWRTLPAGAKLVPAWPNASWYLSRKSKRLGLPLITSQRLRHTFFTWYVHANGFTPELLELGGWKDLTIPARVYAHAAPKRLQQQIERMHRMVVRPRRAARKVSRKREPEPVRVGAVPDRIGPELRLTAPAPDPAHSAQARSDQDAATTSAEAAILAVPAKVSPVGPAGFEPAARGLKVSPGAPHPDLVNAGRVGSPGESHANKAGTSRCTTSVASRK